MAIAKFPPVESANEDGLLGLGGDLNVDTLLLAYSKGIFPWPISSFHPIAWFSPNPRGVLCYSDLHIPKSLEKTFKKNKFNISFNQSFPEVIMNCALSHNRKTPQGKKTFETWITNEIVTSYIDLHYAGNAYSVEVWNKDKLVGGLYGVNIGYYFSGESMFYLEDDASKVGLITLMEHLYKKDVHWIDTQMVTPTVKSLGGIDLPRKIFIEWLKESQSRSSGNNSNKNIFNFFKKDNSDN